MTLQDLNALDLLFANAAPRPWRACGANDPPGCACGLIWSEPLDMSIASTHVPQDSEEIQSRVGANTHAIVALANSSAELIALAREALLARERAA